MDDSGRLIMPGFVGKTFEETGVKKPRPKWLEEMPVLNSEEAEKYTGEGNRHDRRAAEAMAREKDALARAVDKFKEQAK